MEQKNGYCYPVTARRKGYPSAIRTFDTKGEVLAWVTALEYISFDHTGNILNSVKLTRLIDRMLTLATESKSKDIVMNFFSGSAVTAHSVIKKNIEDKGNRRFVAIHQHAEHLVEGRTEEDILYELLLKRGVDLTVPIEQKILPIKLYTR